MPTFSSENNQFLLDEKPFQIISGAIHYFRVVPDYWEDRLLKLKACGFNTVETYIPWNLHEPEKGKYNFEGIANVTRFIEIAQTLDLQVIIRPSPYICAEWEFGGLPYWLLQDENMELRCFHTPYLDSIRQYYDVLLPKLKPLLCTEGGPIIAMQVENEYGSYGNDARYLDYLKDLYKEHEMNVLLFTSDGPGDAMLQGGMIPGILATVNFGSQAKNSFDHLLSYQSNQPFMCMEFWNGWFNHWLEAPHTRDPHEVAEVLEEILSMNASVNFYMFHGGTNFGFYNGANHIKHYEPTVTSYDYDAPLNEYGEPTEKYYLIRDVIKKRNGTTPPNLPEPIARKSFGKVEMAQYACLFHSLEDISQAVDTVSPQNIEKLGQDYGFVLYETIISGPKKNEQLSIQGVCDRALIYLDNQYIAVHERWQSNNQPIMIDIPEEGGKLSILVENMGRINYGPRLKDKKGILGGVHLGNQFLFNWKTYSLKLNDLDSLPFTHLSAELLTENSPTFYKGELVIDDSFDTIVHLPGWKKGNVFINGFNLGRYWEVGPQHSLYLPAPLLKKGINELIVFELHSTVEPSVYLKSE